LNIPSGLAALPVALAPAPMGTLGPTPRIPHTILLELHHTASPRHLQRAAAEPCRWGCHLQFACNCCTARAEYHFADTKALRCLLTMAPCWMGIGEKIRGVCSLPLLGQHNLMSTSLQRKCTASRTHIRARYAPPSKQA